MATVRFSPENLPDDKTDWEALKKLSDEEIERRARTDPDNPPLSDEELAGMRRVSEVRRVRRKLGMTQEEFAATYGLSLATVRDWEQGRTEPDHASKTLLKLIDRIPEQVEAALAEKPQSGTVG